MSRFLNCSTSKPHFIFIVKKTDRVSSTNVRERDDVQGGWNGRNQSSGDHEALTRRTHISSSWSYQILRSTEEQHSCLRVKSEGHKDSCPCLWWWDKKGMKRSGIIWDCDYSFNRGNLVRLVAKLLSATYGEFTPSERLSVYRPVDSKFTAKLYD